MEQKFGGCIGWTRRIPRRAQSGRCYNYRCGGEASGGEGAEDFVDVVQEDGLVAGLDGVREDTFGSGVTEDE